MFIKSSRGMIEVEVSTSLAGLLGVGRRPDEAEVLRGRPPEPRPRARPRAVSGQPGARGARGRAAAAPAAPAAAAAAP